MNTQEARDNQRHNALKRANEQRFKGARLKQELHDLPTMEGRGIAAHVILYDHVNYGFLTPLGLLSEIRGWGPVKATQVCRRLQVGERFRLDEMADRDRELLAGLLTGPNHLDARRGA